jgi:hypothetical protein
VTAPLSEPTRTHLGWLLAKVMKDPNYPEARILWEGYCDWLDTTKGAVTAPQEPEIEAVRKELLCQRSPRCPWDDHAKPYCVNCVARAMLSDFAALTHAIEALRGFPERLTRVACQIGSPTVRSLSVELAAILNSTKKEI